MPLARLAPSTSSSSPETLTKITAVIPVWLMVGSTGTDTNCQDVLLAVNPVADTSLLVPPVAYKASVPERLLTPLDLTQTEKSKLSPALLGIDCDWAIFPPAVDATIAPYCDPSNEDPAVSVRVELLVVQ